MKVNGLNIEEHGSGFSVTIRLFVGAEEQTGEDVSAALAAFEQWIVSGDGLTVSPDEPDYDSPEPEAEAEPEPEPEEAPKRGKRGKRGGKAPTSSAPAEKSTDEAPAPTARTKPGQLEGQSEFRGRKKPTATAKDAPASKATSRKAKATAKSASPSEEITDEDLIKAVSECARKIGAIAAEEIIEGFDVEKLNEVSQERRQELLDAFAAAENDA